MFFSQDDVSLGEESKEIFWKVKSQGQMTRSPASSVHGGVAETRQIHTDYRVLWRKRDSTATLSRSSVGGRDEKCIILYQGMRGIMG